MKLLLRKKPASTVDVDGERDRRIAAGFDFQGKRYQSRPDDRENIAGAAVAALRAIGAGASEGDYGWFKDVPIFCWIAENNDLTPMDAQTMFEFGEAAMAHKQSIIFFGRALKDRIEEGTYVPDVTDDALWSQPEVQQ